MDIVVDSIGNAVDSDGYKEVGVRFMVMVLLALSLGCTPQPESNMQTYVDRLAKVMDVNAPLLPTPQLYPIRSLRALSREPAQLTVGLLDTYQLRHCGLLQLVGERNSILGKVADPFRQYAYQLAFIQTAQRCVLSSKIEPSLAQQLQTAINIKQEELVPVHLSNLIWTSVAMRNQFSQQRWVEADDVNSSAQLALSLNLLQAVSDREREQDFAKDFVSIQETIEKQPLLGSLLFSMTNTAQQLDAINQFINQNHTHISCGKSRDQTQYRYMKNVFQQQYRAKIQPYLATINQIYYRLSPEVRFLNRSELSHQISLEAVHQEFQHSIKQHANVWKTLFQRCEGADFSLSN